MTIRLALVSDTPTLLKIAKASNEEIYRSKGLGYNEIRFFNYLIAKLRSDNSIVFVAELESGIVGTISGRLNPWFMDSSQLILVEDWWWIYPEYRGLGISSKLLQELILWGKARGCTMLMVGSLSPDRSEYYQSQGFIFTESYYIKDI